MPARARARKTSESNPEEDVYSDVEMVDSSATIEKTEDLVDLIEQPAWKTILISLVKSEKMDPWDIDVKVLADKYLQKINSLKSTDLRLPANAILASAILLRFKARALRLPSLEEDELPGMKSLMTEEQLLGGLMPELISPTRSREGKVTLDQLVESIEEILEKTKSKVQREFESRERPVFNLPFASLNMEEKMKEVYERAQALADESGLARFNLMVEGLDSNQTVEFFIGLLFLMNAAKVNAWQDTLFGEIFVSVTNGSAPPQEEAA